MRFIWALMAVLISSPALTRGNLILIGGGDKPAAAIDRFIQESGGKQALILIVPTASELTDTGDYYRDLFHGFGCQNVVPLALRNPRDTERQESIQLVEQCGGVFFAGGDQRRITTLLLGTAFMEALREAFDRGIAIGGTSAGTACMSSLMITGDGDFDRLTANNVEIWEGLGFFPNAILDQHFVARKRHNRLISIVLEHPDVIGIGIDEATAVWLKPDLSFDVLGDGWVVVFDARKAKVSRHRQDNAIHLGGRELRLHILQPGDQFSLAEP